MGTEPTGLATQNRLPSSETGEGRADWYQALRLRERLPPPVFSPKQQGEPDRQRAVRRLDRWLSQSPFSDDGHFGCRLAQDGLSRPEELLALLAESAEELRERTGEAPPWLAELLVAYTEPTAPDAAALPWPEAHRPGAGSSADFLVLVEPLVRRGCERLRGHLAALADGAPSLDPETVLASLVSGLAMGLRHCLARTLVLELQVARLEEELQGDTPEERYRSFIAGLRRPETALDLLARSPVLARYVVEKIAAWEEVALEMLGRLAVDWEEIRRELLPGDDPGVLVEALGGQGDPHRGGRSVCLLRFASGARLVYKPKPLAADAAFQGLLAWVNARGFEPAFRRLRLLERGTYGWMELVETAPCATPEEVRRFYRRQGANLALLYLVEATDFHHENLIAAGEHPVLVDLETLFHPVLARRELGPQQADPGWSLEDSVLRSGLLPSRVWGDAERRGVDLSGLAAAGATIPYWGTVEAGTDAMRFGPKETVLEAAQHRPTLAGTEVSLLAHRDAILAGFDRLYDLLADNRRELLAPDGPLAAFAGCETRLIFRPTQAYFGLLDESFHPYVLGSALDRARFLDRLWAGVLERPFLERLVAFEHRDLEHGDIPYFFTLADVRDVWTSGGERLPGFFAESGLERAARRLDRLGPEDRRRQEWLIRGALAVVELDQGTPRPSYDFRESPEPASCERLLAAAKAAADHLADLAFEEDGHAHWMFVEHDGARGWTLGAAQADLYTGLPGIALALGFVGALTGDERHTRLARLALATQRWQLAQKPGEPKMIGGFNGRGGLVFALTQLGVLWDDPALLAEAEELAVGLESSIEQDESGDLIAGAAGCALALLALHQVRPNPALLGLARRCGERLLATARPMPPEGAGLGWVVKVAGETPLAGISHGAAGIALALLRLDREIGRKAGDGRFREAALRALAYERSLYDPACRNWPDLRSEAREHAGLPEGEGSFMVAWCHGAPGIGLARIAGLPELEDAAVREEIAVAVETTLATGFGTNHSLCHGDLGNLEILLEAASATGDGALRERAYRIAGGILDGIEKNGWLYGLPLGAEPLGLMTGLAGIAYGLARLAAPDRLPATLTLAPPPDPFPPPGA